MGVELLFDQNLSPRLVERLSDLYPDSEHVSSARLDRALDEAVWEHALENGYTIVTKDADFDELGHFHGHPPRVVWLRIGNSTTQQIETLLRDRHAAILELHANPDAGTLELV